MPLPKSTPPSELFAQDLFGHDLAAWAEAQAHALREERIDALDFEHLSDVVGELASEQRRELRARLEVILTGLLRWAEQVDLRGHSWAATIDIQRHCVERLLAQNPSLRPAVPDLVAAAYPAAKARAVLESALFDDSFSGSCPFSENEVLRDGFFPDPYGDDAIRGEGWWKRRP